MILFYLCLTFFASGKFVFSLFFRKIFFDDFDFILEIF